MLIETALAVTAAVVSLRIRGFSRTCGPLLAPLVRSGSRTNIDPPIQRDQLDLLWHGFLRTSRLPWSHCLSRSIAATRYLRARGIPATLQIGARTEGGFAAHAWVVVGNQRLGADRGYYRMRPMVERELQKP